MPYTKIFQQLAAVLAVILMSIGFNSCCTLKTARPAEVTDNPGAPLQDPSYLVVRSCVSKDDFLLAVKDNIQNPIVPDNKPLKVVAEILATEDITFNSLVQVLVSPFVPGHWETVLVKTYQTVRETFGCFIQPWKWGSCWRDVIKEVWVTTQKWVEPQVALYEWQTVAVTKILDRVYSPEATIHYPTYLDDIKIDFNGNKFTIVGYTTTSVKIDVESKLLPLTPEIKLKSVLSVDVQCEITIEGEITITNDKKLVVTANVRPVNIRTPLDKLPKIGGKYFAQYLFTDIGLAKICEKFVEDVSSKSLQNVAGRLLEKNNPKLDFTAKIDYIVQTLGAPRELSKNIWLNINPTEVSSSQIGTNGNDLCIDIGLKFMPTVLYADKPVEPALNKVVFSVQPTAAPVTNINLTLAADRCKLAANIMEAVNKELSDNGNSILKTLNVKNAAVYRTEKNKAVIALDVYSKTKLFKCRIFSAYLLADLTYDNAIKQFALKNVDFDLATQSVLLNSIYKEFADKKIEDAIEQKAAFNIASNYRIAEQLLSMLSYKTDYGVLSGTLSVNSLDGPLITGTSVIMVAKLKGAFAFDVVYSKSEMFASNYLPGRTYESLGLNPATVNDKFVYNRNSLSLNPQIAKFQDDSSYDRVKTLLVINKKLQQDFTKYSHIDLDANASITKNKLAQTCATTTITINNTDPFTYIIDSKGNKIKRRKTFEDRILPGEDFIFIDECGEIKRGVNH